MNIRIYLILLAVVIVGGFSWHAISKNNNPIKSSHLPRLLVEGNKIIRSDTNEPVILRGAVSDFFRFTRFNTGLQQQGLKEELERIKDLKKAGGNLIGLYLSDTEMIFKNKNDLDTFIDFAEEQKIYVYFMPVERDFNGRADYGDGSQGETYEDLKKLIDFLSYRYSDRVNVMYGLGAEPEDRSPDSWHATQLDLVSIVKSNAPNSIIIITGANYGPSGLSQYIDAPFPYTNVIYLGGGYIGENDKEAKNNQERVHSKIKSIIGGLLAQKHPYIAGEFGGNYGGDLSSSNDLFIIKSMLDEMNYADTHYTIYKLSSNFPFDALAIYDTQGNITIRGKVFFEALQQYPPTVF